MASEDSSYISINTSTSIRTTNTLVLLMLSSLGVTAYQNWTFGNQTQSNLIKRLSLICSVIEQNQTHKKNCESNKIERSIKFGHGTKSNSHKKNFIFNLISCRYSHAGAFHRTLLFPLGLHHLLAHTYILYTCITVVLIMPWIKSGCRYSVVYAMIA